MAGLYGKAQESSMSGILAVFRLFLLPLRPLLCQACEGQSLPLQSLCHLLLKWPWFDSGQVLSLGTLSYCSSDDVSETLWRVRPASKIPDKVQSRALVIDGLSQRAHWMVSSPTERPQMALPSFLLWLCARGHWVCREGCGACPLGLKSVSVISTVPLLSWRSRL